MQPTGTGISNTMSYCFDTCSEAQLLVGLEVRRVGTGWLKAKDASICSHLKPLFQAIGTILRLQHRAAFFRREGDAIIP